MYVWKYLRNQLFSEGALLLWRRPSGFLSKRKVRKQAAYVVETGDKEAIRRLVRGLIKQEDICIDLTAGAARKILSSDSAYRQHYATLLKHLVSEIIVRYPIDSRVGVHLVKLYEKILRRCLLEANAERYHRKSRPREHFELFRSCFEGHPNLPTWEIYELKQMGRLEEAVECFRKVHNPNPEIKFEIAEALERLGDDAEAVALYKSIGDQLDDDELLEQFSRHTSAGFAARLRMGDFAGGWAQLMKRRDRATLVPPKGVKEWRGEPVKGETLLILSEGGVGDEIKMASLFPELIERAEGAFVTVDPRLAALMRRSFRELQFVPVPRQGHQDRRGSPRRLVRDTGFPFSKSMPAPIYCLAQFCGHVALTQDLLTFLRPDRESFPRRQGYLVPDPERRKELRQRLDEIGPGLKVGIAWRSEFWTLRRAQFYFDLNDFGPIFSIPGIEYVNLQYDDCKRELTGVKGRFDKDITSFTDLNLREDLETFAALIAELDVVVSPYTMIKEIAGAVGTKTLLMNPSRAAWADWRRNPLTDEDVYYPSVLHIWSERCGDRQSVIMKTADKLQSLSG